MDPKHVNSDDEYYYNPPTKFDQPDQDAKPASLLLCAVLCAVVVLGVTGLLIWAITSA